MKNVCMKKNINLYIKYYVIKNRNNLTDRHMHCTKQCHTDVSFAFFPYLHVMKEKINNSIYIKKVYLVIATFSRKSFFECPKNVTVSS